MSPIIAIAGVSKVYDGGSKALDGVDLEIRRGEIFALLGPNGAGKTTLIGLVCGIVKPGDGTVRVDGRDIARDYRAVRSMIGLVPQELTTDAFETVWATVSFSRGLFGCKPDPAHIEKTLRALSLWDKKDARIRTLSGGMKRRVMIAKALAHEPTVLFLDEPTAGVDVALRKDMWNLVLALRESGTTIVLTTHYIDEAEHMADRVGVIRHGRIVVVEETAALMKKLGKKELTLELETPLDRVPMALAMFPLTLADDGSALTYVYDPRRTEAAVSSLLDALARAGIRLRDLHTRQSTLEDIFVDLVSDAKEPA